MLLALTALILQIKSHTVLVDCGMDRETSVKWNRLCRNEVGFIRARNHGLAGYVFTDFGDSFTVTDMNGEAPITRIIDSMNTSTKGEIRVELLKPPDGERHCLEETPHEGWVEFEDVPGPLGELINNQGPFRIKHVMRVNTVGKQRFDPYSVRVLVPGLRNLPEHTSSGGTIIQVKQPVPVKFRSLQDNILQPLSNNEEFLMFTDSEKFGRAEQLHVAFAGLWQYEQVHGEMPPADDERANEEVVKYAKSYNATGRKLAHHFSVREVDEDVVRTTARFAACTFQPLSCYLGGIVAQEVVKHTGSLTPLQQWLHIDCFELLPDRFVHQNGTDMSATTIPEESRPVDSRYDDLIRIMGRSLHRELMKKRVLVAGSGALGGEILKNCALLGVASDPEGEGHVTVTENEKVNETDLSSQLFLSKADLGREKSDIVLDHVLEINKDLHAMAIGVAAERTTEAESILGETFWKSLDIAITTKEKVQVHNYVDAKCVFYEKALLDLRIRDYRGGVQVILPHKTCSYTDVPLSDGDLDIMPKSIRVFPRSLEDCVKWAKGEFSFLFSDVAENAASFLAAPHKWLQELRGKTLDAERGLVINRVSMEMDSLERVYELLLHKHTEPIDFDACVEKAFKRFHIRHRDMIERLIEDFPEDYTLEDGTRFWSGTKRFPRSLVFNRENPVHLDYVLSAANLFATNFGLLSASSPPPTEWLDPTFVKSIIDGLNVPPRQATEESNDSDVKQDETIARFEALLADLEALAKDEGKLKATQIDPIIFDNRDNIDLDMVFVTAASNLRAANYRMKRIPRHEVKSIATLISPQLVTTAAAAAGLACIEMIKAFQPRKTLEAFKDSTYSLGVNLHAFIEPTYPQKAKDGYDVVELRELKCKPESFTKWDKTVIEGNGTLSEFLQSFKAKTNLNCICLWIETVSNAVYGPRGIIYDAEPIRVADGEVYQHRLWTLLQDTIVDIYGSEILTGRTCIGLECTVQDDYDNGYRIPQLVYKFA